MITTLMVVTVPASRIVFVPDGLYLLQCLWLHLIHPLYENRVHFLALAHPLRRNLQSLIEQVVVRVDDVDKIVDASGRMACPVKMDVDAAGLVGKSPGFAEPSC